MVDIQNATLAGGVAIGSACDLAVSPAAALGVGFLAGIVSVVGYTSLQSRVEQHLKIYDTCGILNLHGMPGILGGIVSVVACAGIPFDRLLLQVDPSISADIAARSSSGQALFQLAFLAITLSVSTVAGFITGVLISNLDPLHTYFEDSALWEVPELEKPYFFDKRGEVEHKPTTVGLTRADVEKIIQEMAMLKKSA